MAVCRYGREIIEQETVSGHGNWWPADGQPWPKDGHDAHQPATMTTVELIGEHDKQTDCEWCAFPTGPAQYRVGGDGCCPTHLPRAIQEVTALQEAAGAVRGAPIQP